MVPVDMCLEQTINADAASRKTGIAAFTQSESARKRWTRTHSAKSAVVRDLLNMAGLKQTDDCSKDLRSQSAVCMANLGILQSMMYAQIYLTRTMLHGTHLNPWRRSRVLMLVVVPHAKLLLLRK